MGRQISFLKNDASQGIRIKMWRKSYNRPTTPAERNDENGGESHYPGPEDDVIVEPGHFFRFDATKLDNMWLRTRRLCGTEIYYRVYVGGNTTHSGTLEVAELLINGGIILSTTTNNGELQKRIVPRAQFQRRFLISWRTKAVKAEMSAILVKYDEMVNDISLINNQTSHNIIMKVWSESYIDEARRDTIYCGLKDGILVEPGKFFYFNATQLLNLWLKKRQSYQVEFNYRVYLAGNSVHSCTLEVAELINNGAIILRNTINNDEIQKRFVSRVEFQKRFLPCVRTKQQLIKEMEEDYGCNIGPTATATGQPSEVHSEGSLPRTAGTVDDGVSHEEGDSGIVPNPDAGI